MRRMCKGCWQFVFVSGVFLWDSGVYIPEAHTLFLCHARTDSLTGPTSPPHGANLLQIIRIRCATINICFFSLSLSLVTQLGESPFVNGKITHKIKVVPSANLTVHCTVTNRLGNDSRAINVSSCKYKVIIWSFYLCRLHFSFMKSLICLPKCFPTVLTNSFHLHVNLASCLHALTKQQYCSRYVHQGKSTQFGIVCSVCGVTSLHTNLVAIRAIS